MSPETLEALEKLETKIAFLERANAELSDVVYRQQQELAQLRAGLTGLAARVDSGPGQERPYSLEEEKPPHY